MRAFSVCILWAGLNLLFVAHAASAVVVPWAQRTTVDSDGDGINDLVDNGPGFFDVTQIDTDADGIGDVIDPTPSSNNPNFGDMVLGMNGPHTIAAGAHVFVDYLMMAFEPAGQFGHIDLDLGGNGVYDATYFGPLIFNMNQIDIPPSLFVDPTWNLNVPGSYTLHALAHGPGGSSHNYTISGAIVTPEPATCALIALSGLAVLGWRRR
jgi:hypothetical protein